MAVETGKKRKGTALLAVMNENCTSCAGSPLCEVHCPVENCINLLYEETPQGGLKPYRVWVDNEKCIGCQMCYSDDLTKIHQHKDTGEIYYEYAGRFYDGSKSPLDPSEMPKKFQLQLIGTKSEDRLDKKICPWDAIRMYEFDEGLEVSRYFYDPADIKSVDGLYVIDSEGKERLEEKQSEAFAG
ncbi:MAG: NADH-quinone oxidoreductase subunit I [Candidatus Binatia bacterium]